MQPSSLDLIRSRETLAALLDELGLPAFRFSVEPEGEVWRLTLECEAPGGWQRLELDLGPADLEGAAADPAARRALAVRLDRELRGCLRMA